MWGLLKESFNAWVADKVPRLAAALSFYMVFSLAPLLMIVIAIAGLVFGQDEVRSQVAGQIEGLVGASGGEIVLRLLDSINKPAANVVAAAAGLVTLVFGATGVFGELQESLNTIWKVPPKTGRAFMTVLRSRFTSFLMILGLGFLLLVSLVVSTALAALSGWIADAISGSRYVPQAIDLAFSFVVITALFAMMFKILPDARIRWKDVVPGAALTALMFAIGKFLIGLYLGKSSVASPYGAAGSLIVILLWVYYSAQILYFGAEFTYAYSKRRVESAPQSGDRRQA